MKNALIGAAALALCAGAAAAQVDGINIPSDATTNGLALLGTQTSATGFGNAIGGGQDSNGGSELNQMWGSIDGGTLNLSITGNLEGNFNKMWIFFDATQGGENTLAGDNADGGFGEINNLGYTFDSGFIPDHGIRIEVGGGFLGIRGFDLIDNTGGDIWTDGAGTGALPLVGAAGGFGVTTGWDNSNVLGVDDVSAAGAATATTGWEFQIDMATFFGTPRNFVNVMAIVTSGDGGFSSNQVLPAIDGGGANLGGNVDFTQVAGTQFATIPAPGSLALLGLGGLAAARRRR